MFFLFCSPSNKSLIYSVKKNFSTNAFSLLIDRVCFFLNNGFPNKDLERSGNKRSSYRATRKMKLPFVKVKYPISVEFWKFNDTREMSNSK